MMTVVIVAKQSGATPDAVCYYTRMGLLKPMRNPERQYKPSEVSWLKFIRQAKVLGYTLKYRKSCRIRTKVNHLVLESERYYNVGL